MSEKDSPRPSGEDTEGSKEGSTDSSSLDELPDTVYVPLGRRGMESILLKVCPDCDKENLALIHKTTTGAPTKRDVQKEDTPLAEKEIVDYLVCCQECGHQFIIRLTRLHFKDELVQTLVSIRSVNGESELWLGNLF